MIKEVSGDILLSQAQAIAHGVAPMDDFKQGLALALRERWPGMYKDFRHYCQTTHPKCGSAWSWKGPGGPIIINLFTQEPPQHAGGRPGTATIEHVGHALKELHSLIAEHKLTSLALPRLATGVGGLDWKHIQPLIAKHLEDTKARIFVYTNYHKGEAAAES